RGAGEQERARDALLCARDAGGELADADLADAAPAALERHEVEPQRLALDLDGREAELRGPQRARLVALAARAGDVAVDLRVALAAGVQLGERGRHADALHARDEQARRRAERRLV